jgi:hypothetical protein
MRAIRFFVAAGLGFIVAIVSLSLLLKFTPLALFAALNAGVLCGTYSILDPDMPRPQRLAAVYLMFVGIAYFWAAISCLLVNADLLAIVISNYLTVPPFALFHLFERCTVFFPCTQFDIPFPLEVPLAQLQGIHILAMIELGLSVIAVVAAYFLSKRARWAYFIWTGLVSLAIAAAMFNIGADELSARNFGPAGHISQVAYTSILWAASYIIAYWVLRRATQSTHQSNQADTA